MHPSQRLLLIDTAGLIGVIALSVDGKLISKRQSEQARDHAAVINTAIVKVLEDGNLRLADLTGICVMAGPGSYTGLRIALATSKGLCYALEIPLFLQNNLEILAADARRSAPDYDCYFAILPARSGEYFLAAYGSAGNLLIAPRHAMKEEACILLEGLPAKAMMCGTGSVAEEVCLRAARPFIEGKDTLSAWAQLAFAQVACGESTPLAEAVPLYLKAAFTTTSKLHIKQ